MSDQTSMNVQQQDLNTAVTYMKENDAFVRLSENGIRLDTLDFIPVMNRMGIQGDTREDRDADICQKLDKLATVLSEPEQAERDDYLDVLYYLLDDYAVDFDPVTMNMNDPTQIEKALKTMLDKQTAAAKKPVTLRDPGSDALSKAKKVYGDSTIAKSDAGTIADELRSDIHESLSRMLKTEAFRKDEARSTFSNMVLLEVMKRSRRMNDANEPVAGEVEKAFAAKPEAVTRAMRDHACIKAASKDLDVEKLRQLLMTDGARTLADQLNEVAKEYAPEKKGNAQTQEVQKQADAPKIMM